MAFSVDTVPQISSADMHDISQLQLTDMKWGTSYVGSVQENVASAQVGRIPWIAGSWWDNCRDLSLCESWRFIWWDPLYLDLRLTQGDVQKLMQTFHFGPTAAQYRWWKSKEAASFALSKSPGGRGYLWDLEDAVRSLYNEENMSALTVENGVHLPMFLSVDGGWLDHSNSAIFVKLVRSDSSWVEKGNRHKVPSLAATLAVLSSVPKWNSSTDCFLDTLQWCQNVMHPIWKP